MSQKHILFLTWKDIRHPHAGGAERVIYEYASRLARDGYRVTWFASAFPGAQPEETIDGINIIRRYNNHTIWMRAHSWYKQFKREDQIDIIIDEAGGWPLLSPLYEREVPIFFFVHQEFDAFLWPIGSLAKRAYRYFISLYRHTPTITVSDSTRDELVHDFGFSPETITVIDNTTELTPIDSVNIGAKTHDFVFLGRITSIKRPIDAVLAFAYVVSELPDDSRLHIIGNVQDTRYVEALKTTIQQHNLQERVILHGHMAKDEFSILLRTSRALLVPSEKE
jgi:glycosyltransferase involved in cell wall biosynthesis